MSFDITSHLGLVPVRACDKQSLHMYLIMKMLTLWPQMQQKSIILNLTKTCTKTWDKKK